MITHDATHCIICENKLSGKQTKFCSYTCKIKGQSNSNYISQQLRGKNRKVRLISMSGNKCISCGFNGDFCALSFHHINPRQKSFPLDIRNLSNRSWESIINEFKKC